MAILYEGLAQIILHTSKHQTQRTIQHENWKEKQRKLVDIWLYLHLTLSGKRSCLVLPRNLLHSATNSEFISVVSWRKIAAWLTIALSNITLQLLHSFFISESIIALRTEQARPRIKHSYSTYLTSRRKSALQDFYTTYITYSLNQTLKATKGA